MKTLADLAELRSQIGQWRRARQRIAFVPTMGNLHDGHMQLVREAHKLADRVVVSIFVNPLQFGLGEDFESYPRTLEVDQSMLEQEQTDLLFAPVVKTVYPSGQLGHTEIRVPGISEALCGAHRPGHFVGVATVVCKLFNMVQPDVALFGQKDFQQLMVIRRMVADLSLPVEIVGVDTVREQSGLARSSRNRYLDDDERVKAPLLHQRLLKVADALRRGERDFPVLEHVAMHHLSEMGFVPDYVSIRRSEDLAPAGPDDREFVILAAARLGAARLIDNVQVKIKGV